MPIKLIALDIDDTLLNSQKKILPSTKTAIQKALAAGIKVVLCSGRPLPGVQPFLDELDIKGDDQYVITYNGSVIISVTGQVMSSLNLTKDTYQQIDQFANDNHLQYNVLDADGHIYTSNTDVSRITVIQAMENDTGLFIRKPDELDDTTTIVKGIFVGEVADLDHFEPAVEAEFGQTQYVVRAADNFLEIMNAAANKGAALKQLTQSLAIKLEEVMVFGDEKNDIPMFDFAGIAVAMGNGSNIAKSHANYITDSNDNDGIANALTKFL